MSEQSQQIKTVKDAIDVVRPFVSRQQFLVMEELSRTSEEKEFFQEKLLEYANRIAGMAKSYEQDGKGEEAVVFLHYFHGGSDWYITEKDQDGGVQQAFGYAVLNGDEQNAELGYISIEEMTGLGVELDLHFDPRTLGEVKRKRAGRGGGIDDESEETSHSHTR